MNKIVMDCAQSKVVSVQVQSEQAQAVREVTQWLESRPKDGYFTLRSIHRQVRCILEKMKRDYRIRDYVGPTVLAGDDEKSCTVTFTVQPFDEAQETRLTVELEVKEDEWSGDCRREGGTTVC